MPAMPRPRPPYLQRHINRHGKVVWYVRVGRGPKTRIRGTYGSDEFNAAYQAAITGERPVPSGAPAKDTLAWLVGLHRKSSYWTDLAKATRKKRDQIFVQIIKTSGKFPVSSVNRKAIEAARDRRQHTPSQARHFVHTMRSLFKWALDSDLVKVDPTAGVTVKKVKGGIKPWTDDDIAKFETRWPRGTRERVMFDVFVYTGLRIGDAARLGKQHVRDGTIAIDTEKTGTRVTIPVLAPLAETLKTGPTGDLAFIATKNGAPMLKNSLGNAFRAACRAAGVDKSAHGIRKAAATHAASHGATGHELDAIFGWTGGQMAALYTEEADRKKLAKGAMSKLDRTETGTSMLPPENMVGAPGRENK
jgi:integrase